MNQIILEPNLARRPKVGVVLGSGGIKALGALALFEFLTEAEIEVDLMVGCSGGSIVCGLLGAGYSPTECRDLIATLLDRKLFAKTDYRTLLGMAGLGLGRFDKSSGMLKPEALRQL